MSEHVLPTDRTERKNIPMARGLLYYFPNALAAVAEVSRVANEQHNPGEEMHWAFGKSNDHADCILRHQVDAGTMDDDNLRHSAKVAWRALAQLEEELIAEGAKPGKSVRFPEEPKKEPEFAGWKCRGCGTPTRWHLSQMDDELARREFEQHPSGPTVLCERECGEGMEPVYR